MHSVAKCKMLEFVFQLASWINGQSTEFDQEENHGKCQTKWANWAKIVNWQTFLKWAKNFGLKVAQFIKFFFIFLYFKAPDVQELSHEDFFQLLRLSMKGFFKNGENLSAFFKPYRFYVKPVSTTLSMLKSN